MTYLLDTNVCIALLKGRSEFLKSKVEASSSQEVFIPSIVRYELLYGANKSQDPYRTLEILHDFLKAFPSLPFDNQEAEVCGGIRADLEKKGMPIGPLDTMIAAVALANDLTLITRNTREFQRVSGLHLENWEG